MCSRSPRSSAGVDIPSVGSTSSMRLGKFVVCRSTDEISALLLVYFRAKLAKLEHSVGFLQKWICKKMI